jgi:hypothetical protein
MRDDGPGDIKPKDALAARVTRYRSGEEFGRIDESRLWIAEALRLEEELSGDSRAAVGILRRRVEASLRKRFGDEQAQQAMWLAGKGAEP